MAVIQNRAGALPQSVGFPALAPDRGNPRRQGLTGIGAVVLLLAAITSPATAATIVVDNSDCTLVEAISNANSDSTNGGNGCAAGSGADTIRLPASSTVMLTQSLNNLTAPFGNSFTALPLVTSTITIEGNGATVTRDASAPKFRILRVASGGNLTIQRLTISNGFLPPAGPVDEERGGGVYVNAGGRLSLVDSTVRGHSAGGSGGGILNFGTLQLLRTTVAGNTVTFGSGAGIANGTLGNGGGVTITSSTISGNVITASNGGDGAGISSEGGTVTITDSTITGNVSNSTLGAGGTSSDNNGRYTVTRSIISGNRAPRVPAAAEIRSLGGLGDEYTLNGYNLIGDNGAANSQSATLGATDIVPSQDISSILAPLADNGGPTPTHALLPGSPAVNSVASGCAANAIDQRGQLRPETSACDAGAFELSGSYVVTSLGDTDDGSCDASHCSLREAIRSANGTTGIPDIISFNVPGGGVIALASQLPEITAAGGPVRIDGPSDAAQAIILDGSSGVRLMQTAVGSVVGMNYLTLRNGRAPRTSQFGDGEGGGAIRARGALTLNACALTGNVAGDAYTGRTAGPGGAIESSGPLTIISSTLSGNAGGTPLNGRGGSGGAIFASGPLTIVGSTLSGNQGGRGNNADAGLGGAIRASGSTVIVNSTLTGNAGGFSKNAIAGNGGAISTSGPLTLINTTIHDNAAGLNNAPFGTPGSGSALHATGPVPTLINTIISSPSPGLCAGFSGSAAGRSSLATDTSCGSGGLLIGGSPVTVDALNLGSLASNGGLTQTLALKVGSVAIDAGSDADCAADPVNGVDQRGVSRPQEARCDVGAFEAALTNVSITKTASPETVIVGEAVRFTLTVRNLDSRPVSAVALSDLVPSAFRVDAVTPGSALCLTGSNNTVTCALPTLAPNATATVLIDTTALSAGAITNTATAGDAGTDRDIRDNSSSATVTIVAQDTTPDAISFDSRSNVARSSTQTSNTVTIGGLNVAAPISVSSGSQYSIGCTEAGFTSVAGTIGNGQTVCVRHTAASGFGTDTVTTLTVGDGTGTFTSTTEARDITPEAFSFDNVMGVVEPGSTQRSAAITIGGVNDSTPFSVTGGRASTNGLPCDPLFGETSGTVSNGSQITVCHVAGSFGSVNTTTLTLGADGVLVGTSASFSSTTRDAVVVPDAFAFTDNSNVEPGSTQSSNVVTITGLEASATVTVSNGEVSINGGAFGAGGTIEPGQTVQVRHTASAAFSGTVTSTVTIGGVQGTFSSTTRAAVAVPNAFTFASNANAERGSTQTSNVVTITGLEAAATVTVSNGEVSINGGVFGAGGSIEPGQTVQVRHTASAAFSGTVTSTVTIGGVQGTFSSTTRPAVVVPDAFTFGSRSNVERGSVQTSAAVAITGLEATATVTVSNGEVSINGGAFGSGGTIEPGQTVQVRHTASAAFSGTVTSTVTIGGVQGTFSSTTRPAVAVPNAFTFASNANAERGSTQTSNVVTITGLEAAATVTVSNGEVSINGGAFGSGGTIEPGQTVQVRHTASAAFSGTVTSTVTIGGVQGTFSSTTLAEATAPVVSLDMNDVDFGRGYLIRFREITLNTSETQVVTLTNTGNAPLQISSITTTGDFRHTSTCGSTVPAAGSCAISIVFKPTQVGTRTGETRIVSNAVSSPDLISLNGVGKGLVPAIKTNASSYNFGNGKVGTTSPDRALVITSAGTGPLEIRSISVSGDYSGSHNCPRLLDAGKSCTLTGRFKPKAKGARPGTITLSTSAPGSPTVITLSGNGT